MVKCPDCGAGADLTKDGRYAHCASCTYSSFCFLPIFFLFGVWWGLVGWRLTRDGDLGNNIFEPGKEGSGYKGGGSGSGDGEEGEESKKGEEGEGKKEGES